MTTQPTWTPGIRPALVGRDAELAAMEELFSSTAPRRVALITGAPGAGCTALLRAISDQAVAKNTVVLAGFSLTEARQPYGTLLAPLLDPAPGSEAFRHLDEAWPAELRELARKAARDPGDCLLAFVERYACVVSAIADGRPPVLFIDDVQAADTTSLETLPLMARRLATSRWVLGAHLPLGSQAPERAAVGALIAGGLPADTLHVILGPLADADLATLVRQAVGLRPSEQLISSLARHLGVAAGLPGPTCRLATTLRTARRIRRIDTLDYMIDEGEPIALRADDPLVAPLGRLESPAALVASLIATLGTVDPETLLAMSERLGLDEVSLASQLDQLIGRGILRADAASRLRVAVPALAHLLVTQTPGQAMMHHVLADSLLAQGEALPSDQVHRLADHLSVLFCAADEDGPAGAPAPDIALEILTQAIVTADHHADPIRLSRWNRAVLAILTHMSRQRTAYDAPLTAAKVLAMLPEALARMRRLGYLADTADVGVRALTLIDRRDRAAIVMETAAALADSGDLTRAAGLLAGVDLDELTGTGRLAKAARLLCLTDALHQARRLFTGSAPDPAMVIERALVEAAHGDTGRWAEAWSAWQVAHPQASTAVDPECIRELACVGDLEAARTILVAAGRDGWSDPTDAQMPIGQAWLRGDWDRVVDVAGRLAALSSTAPPAQSTAAIRALVAEVWQQRGEPRRGLRWVRSLPDDHAAGPIVAWSLGGALSGAGEPATGHAVLTGAVRRYLNAGQCNGVDLLLVRIIDLRIGIGDWKGACDAEDQLDDVAQTLGSRQALLLRDYARARLHKDVDAAEAALALAVSARMTFQQAKLHLLIGELGREPQSHLQQALTLFQHLDARPWLQDVVKALRGHGLSVPRRHVAPTAMTDAETEVVELVAAGFGNRQIATRLRISEKTVEGVLTRVLAKTGCRNRVELAVRHRQSTGQSP